MPLRLTGVDEPTPIFIFGGLGRSGTNFLSDLLCLHPDCVPAHPLDEDFFHFYGDLLERYVRLTVNKWHPDWGLSDGGADRLLASLGHGLLAFLRDTVDETDTTRLGGAKGEGRSRVVTKSPSVKNLSLFPRLFPGIPALVLVRDGRAVVESHVRSFGSEYETVMRKWAWAARVIRQTAGTPGQAEWPFLLVRYETLLTDLASELRRLFAFTGLDPERFDFAAASSLPVRGSSTYRGHRGDVNWQPVRKSEKFRPMERWRDWSTGRHDRFNWLAGQELKAFGYEAVGPTDGLLHVLRNRLRDAMWYVRATRAEKGDVREDGVHE